MTADDAECMTSISAHDERTSFVCLSPDNKGSVSMTFLGIIIFKIEETVIVDSSIAPDDCLAII